MKRELRINFDEETTLRSFVQRKLSNLSAYTTLPLINQMEMVLNDLPSEIAYLFIQKEKMTGSMTEILEFCDSIQDFASDFAASIRMTTENESPKHEEEHPVESFQALNRMESFTFDPDLESEIESVSSSRGSTTTSSLSGIDYSDQSSLSSYCSEPKRGSGRGVGSRGKVTKRGRGRPPKLKMIPEEV